MGSGFSGAFFLSSFIENNNFIGLVLAALDLGGGRDCLWLQGSGPSSPVAVCRLFLAWLFLLWSTGSRVLGTQWLQYLGSVLVAPGLWSTGLVAVAPALCCSGAPGILPDRGWNLCPLHWQLDSLPLHTRQALRCLLSDFLS